MKQIQIAFDIAETFRFQFIKLDSLWEINKVFVSSADWDEFEMWHREGERKVLFRISPDELDKGVDARESKHLLFRMSFLAFSSFSHSDLIHFAMVNGKIGKVIWAYLSIICLRRSRGVLLLFANAAHLMIITS